MFRSLRSVFATVSLFKPEIPFVIFFRSRSLAIILVFGGSKSFNVVQRRGAIGKFTLTIFTTRSSQYNWGQIIWVSENALLITLLLVLFAESFRI